MRDQLPAFRLRSALALAFAAFVTIAAPAPASAQGFFDLLFGGFRRSAPPPSSSFADPNFDDRSGEEGRRDTPGPGVAYCVRLCDGRHFPINYRGATSAADICRSFCPAAPTQIFSGGSIARAVAANGRRYSDLPNAFVYREKLVADCTCDGKSPTGLVRQDADDDPTLRPGDIVATGKGLMAYRGIDRQNAQFTPIGQAGLSPAMRQQLSMTRVLPARTAEELDDGKPAAASRNVPQRDRAAR